MRSAVEPVKVVTVPALIWPLVLASRVLRAAAVRLASVRVTASLPNPETPVVLYAVVAAAAEPVIVVTEVALIVPDVLESSVFRSDAVTLVSVSVII